MSTLEDTVRSVVKDFMDNGQLFTALDVSNRVKLTHPLSKHREIREVVRSLFLSDMSPASWSRTPITVNLSDGTTAEALLYHPLNDQFDLDNKYDQQQRSQVVVNPVAATTATLTPSAAPSSVATATVLAPAPGAATVTLSATTAVPMPTARDLWDQLFATQPSLFPAK